MSSSVEEHVIYQIANAPVRAYPYPHIYVESVFPGDFYAALRKNWPAAEHLVRLDSTGRVTKGAYPERFIMPLRQTEVDRLPAGAREFWKVFSEWFLDQRFLDALIEKFEPQIRRRFTGGLDKLAFSVDSLVVRDHTHYKLGPHTDAPHRLMSLLFYCPDDDRKHHLGTSIYIPLDPGFRCKGGPHYPHDWFKRVMTMEYRPNTLFAFVKTDNSFHGVEPLGDADVLRDVLLYDIRVSEAPRGTDETEAGSPSLGMKMLKRVLFGAKG